MSKRKRNYERKSRKKGWKIALAIVAAVLADLLLFTGIMAAVTPKELNPDNLLKTEHYVEAQMLDKTSKGLNIDWKDDGSIILSGKHSDDDISNNSIHTVDFAAVTLEKGEYTLSCGNDKASAESFSLYAIVDGQFYHTYDDGSCTFSVSDSSLVVIGFGVKNNHFMLYTKLEPTLAAGAEVIDLYVEN